MSQSNSGKGKQEIDEEKSLAHYPKNDKQFKNITFGFEFTIFSLFSLAQRGDFFDSAKMGSKPAQQQLGLNLVNQMKLWQLKPQFLLSGYCY